MSSIRVFPLGAGRDVGRSCIIVHLGGKTIMLDCGVHMGIHDEKKFPDFRFLCGDDSMDNYIDCVLVTHFHLDHCAALPYLTEKIGYNGPIYMSTPTKAICPILLDDFRKVCEDKLSENEIYTKEMIDKCMEKVRAIKLHEVIQVDDTISIKAYYAGHVLGAVMFFIRVGDESVVYTGDFNMTADSHLGSAWIDRCRPNILISESTYATTVRESRKCREIDFLRKVHETIEKGGKVLIPVFALGRAQELCILLDQFWKRTNLTVPVYVSPGMAERSIQYYKLFVSWTNEHIKSNYYQQNSFDFSSVEIFDRTYMDRPGPMVVLASPGMLHAGLSLQIFKKWAANPKNTVILPGYCVANTVGNKVLNGEKRIELDYGSNQVIEVNLQVCNMSFSAHADAVGILQLIDFCRPRNAVILVHGDSTVMDSMQNHIKEQFDIDCFCPANGEMLTISTETNEISLKVPSKLLNHTIRSGCKKLEGTLSLEGDDIFVNGDHTSDNSGGCVAVAETKLYMSSNRIIDYFKETSNFLLPCLSLLVQNQIQIAISQLITHVNTYIYTEFCSNGLFPIITEDNNQINYGSICIKAHSVPEGEDVSATEKSVSSANSETKARDLVVNVAWSISDTTIAYHLIDHIKSLSSCNLLSNN